MRRATLFTLIVLFLLLVAAAVFQIRSAHGPRRFPGPGSSSVSPPHTP